MCGSARPALHRPAPGNYPLRMAAMLARVAMGLIPIYV